MVCSHNGIWYVHILAKLQKHDSVSQTKCLVKEHQSGCALWPHLYDSKGDKINPYCKKSELELALPEGWIMTERSMRGTSGKLVMLCFLIYLC